MPAAHRSLPICGATTTIEPAALPHPQDPHNRLTVLLGSLNADRCLACYGRGPLADSLITRPPKRAVGYHSVVRESAGNVPAALPDAPAASLRWALGHDRVSPQHRPYPPGPAATRTNGTRSTKTAAEPHPQDRRGPSGLAELARRRRLRRRNRRSGLIRPLCVLKRTARPGRWPCTRWSSTSRSEQHVR